MGAHNVRSKDEFQQTLRDHGVVVVDFYATWCAPCKAIAPVFAHSSELDKFQHMRFVKFDVDELKDLAAELGVRSMPTFQLYRDGVKAGEVRGADQGALMRLLEEGV